MVRKDSWGLWKRWLVDLPKAVDVSSHGLLRGTMCRIGGEALQMLSLHLECEVRAVDGTVSGYVVWTMECRRNLSWSRCCSWSWWTTVRMEEQSCLFMPMIQHCCQGLLCTEHAMEVADQDFEEAKIWFDKNKLLQSKWYNNNPQNPVRRKLQLGYWV